MIWVDGSVQIDNCDGEPLCGTCGNSLNSERDTSEEIAVKCLNKGCDKFNSVVIRATSYGEITSHFYALARLQVTSAIRT